ncbi:DUF998 domain-containing protein [Listeria welshimeri]|uniref:DUF998 domain-containing protein n=1 Tax=Listeria welshimeri TaxID=1643 RepID=UPI00162A2984|nr:DUF998 domain-containing protein [Listeria welshimeri]MBC1253195.1 DUF998 domain-containing protein [Listeria welshimeri]MBC1495818.1 DUF998 domain-containing protein [Listeria welshimeri]MBC1631478.1 DUF998 domain-containing protein [Listeria welshimeri]MBC1637305.1 DUF998 domain-containing protein [Listeria welshimeri]MBC1673137.1 DUF998 domain-containing protein [Listeria welshimeri]
MKFLKKYGFYFLILAVLSDFLTPYILGIFYPGLNQMTRVMSVFGDVASPVRGAFLVWSVVSGVLFVLSLPAIYQSAIKQSRTLAILLVSAIGLYGIGDCIFTGLFSIDTEQSSWTFSTWVHNIGSGLGYAGFLIFPLFLVILYRKKAEKTLSNLYLVLLIVSLLSAGIYGLARIPAVNYLPVLDKIGFCQRISFFFNYLPMVVFGVEQIRRGYRKP